MRLSEKQKLERDVEWLKRDNASLVLEKLRQAEVISRLTAAVDSGEPHVAREVIHTLLAALRSRLHETGEYRRDCGCDGCIAVRMAEELGYGEESEHGAQARNGGQGERAAGSSEGRE